MKKVALFSSMAILGLAVTADAAIILDITKIAGPRPSDGDFNAPEDGLNGQDWTAWQLSVSATEGEQISAVDVLIQGDLLQRWSDVNFDGIADPSPVGPPSNGRGDSHLTPLTGALIGSAPTEDNTGAGSPIADAPPGLVRGLGTSLSGAWGIPGGNASQVDLAYFVIPSGSVGTPRFPKLNIRALIANDAGAPVELGTFDIFIPEPVSISLFGLGLAGLGSVRRRGHT